MEEHARRLPQEQFHQSVRNQRYVNDCVDSFNQGTVEDLGESGASIGLTRKQHEDLRKHVRGGGQVIREVVVVEQDGPGAPEVYTSLREDNSPAAPCSRPGEGQDHQDDISTPEEEEQEATPTSEATPPSDQGPSDQGGSTLRP